MKKILLEKTLPQLDRFKGAINMNQVRSFAEETKKLGERFGEEKLINLADNLIESEYHFDIQKMENLLEDLSGMIQELSS